MSHRSIILLAASAIVGMACVATVSTDAFAYRGGRVEVVDSNILTVATSLPLDEFAKARNAAPAQVFDYLLNNE